MLIPQRKTHSLQEQSGLTSFMASTLCEIIEKIPPRHCYFYSDNPWYTSDGFTMLDHLIKHLDLQSIQKKIIGVTDLAHLEYNPEGSLGSYMSQVHHYATSFHGITVNQIISLLPLTCFDEPLFPGTTNSLLMGEPSLLHANLPTIESSKEQELHIQALTGHDLASVNQATVPLK